MDANQNPETTEVRGHIVHVHLRHHGEVVGAILYVVQFPPLNPTDVIIFPDNVVSFEDAIAIAEQVLTDVQSGIIGDYVWKRNPLSGQQLSVLDK
jgi:hypothetical protein